MQRTRFLVSLAATAILVAAPAALGDSGRLLGWSTAQAQPAAKSNISIGLFFTELQPQGEWVQHPKYNYVWVPTKVDTDWAPYTNGHWVNTDRYGWYFESDEPFAWIVYH